MKLTEELSAPLRVMQEMARRIAKVMVESKLAVKEDDYVSSFKVELMDAVIQWCRGASFAEICKVKLSVTQIRAHSSLSAFLFEVVRPVRGQHDPRLQTSAGAHPPDGTSCQGHWEPGVGREVPKGG